jgi:hypothetical protein
VASTFASPKKDRVMERKSETEVPLFPIGAHATKFASINLEIDFDNSEMK